ncbi:MAG: 3-isopropylmalate dehydratase large subunit [Candidatus Omnitrophota bacterium]
MGQTLAEKILSRHAKLPLEAGDYVLAKVDSCLLQDGTGPLAVKQFQSIGFKKLAAPKRTIFFLDHAAPSPRTELSNSHLLLRKFAKDKKAILFDINEGVCHQIIAERFAKPGDVLVGADSHTCSAGALCCFSTGMGSTDLAVAMALGKTWFLVPNTIRVIINGKLPKGVYSKDIMLSLIGGIKSDGATYKAFEFEGSTISNMPVSQRLTLTNMAVESGAKAGLIASDAKTKEFLKQQGRAKDYKALSADKNAKYERTVEINAGRLVPMVSLPHEVDNVKPINKVKDVKVNQVLIGSCTNARLDDLELVASMWRGRKRNKSLRVIITPASKKVYLDAARKGLIKQFLEFGAAVTNPGCGACVGVHMGILADGERCLATINRNFKGRMGNPNAFIYLGSPATAAATAIEGKIADPRKYL